MTDDWVTPEDDWTTPEDDWVTPPRELPTLHGAENYQPPTPAPPAPPPEPLANLGDNPDGTVNPTPGNPAMGGFGTQVLRALGTPEAPPPQNPGFVDPATGIDLGGTVNQPTPENPANAGIENIGRQGHEALQSLRLPGEPTAEQHRAADAAAGNLIPPPGGMGPDRSIERLQRAADQNSRSLADQIAPENRAAIAEAQGGNIPPVERPQWSPEEMRARGIALPPASAIDWAYQLANLVGRGAAYTPISALRTPETFLDMIHEQQRRLMEMGRHVLTLDNQQANSVLRWARQTLGDRAGNFTRDFVALRRGEISPAEFQQTLGDLLESSNWWRAARLASQSFVDRNLPVSPEAAQSILGQIAQGMGSSIGGVLLHMLPGGMWLAGAAFTGAGVDEAVQRAISGGASNEQIIRSMLGGGISGATDLAELEVLMRPFAINRGAYAFMLGTARRMIEQGATESIQEGVQELIQNLNEGRIYNPQRKAWENVAESAALGAAVGAIMGGITAPFGRGGATGDVAREPRPGVEPPAATTPPTPTEALPAEMVIGTPEPGNVPQESRGSPAPVPRDTTGTDAGQPPIALPEPAPTFGARPVETAQQAEQPIPPAAVTPTGAVAEPETQQAPIPPAPVTALPIEEQTAQIEALPAAQQVAAQAAAVPTVAQAMPSARVAEPAAQAVPFPLDAPAPNPRTIPRPQLIALQQQYGPELVSVLFDNPNVGNPNFTLRAALQEAESARLARNPVSPAPAPAQVQPDAQRAPVEAPPAPPDSPPPGGPAATIRRWGGLSEAERADMRRIAPALRDAMLARTISPTPDAVAAHFGVTPNVAYVALRSLAGRSYSGVTFVRGDTPDNARFRYGPRQSTADRVGWERDKNRAAMERAARELDLEYGPNTSDADLERALIEAAAKHTENQAAAEAEVEAERRLILEAEQIMAEAAPETYNDVPFDIGPDEAQVQPVQSDASGADRPVGEQRPAPSEPAAKSARGADQGGAQGARTAAISPGSAERTKAGRAGPVSTDTTGRSGTTEPAGNADAVRGERKPNRDTGARAGADTGSRVNGAPGPDVPFERPAVFYSALTRAAETAKITKGTPDQWLATLRNTPGVKQDEIDWSGLDPWLRQQTGSVTREAVTDFLRANEVRVEEVTKGGKAPAGTAEAIDKWLTDSGNSESENRAVVRDAVNGDAGALAHLEGLGIPSELLNPIYAAVGDGATKFHSYALPGGENYRELLLTLPDPGRIPTFEEWYEKTHISPLSKYADDPHMMAIFRAKYESEAKNFPREGLFRRSHWDKPNVLAHVRFSDRTDADGKKVLLVDEVQSDWHQQGRAKGYAGDLERSLTAEERELRDLNAMSWDGKKWTPEMADRQHELTQRVGDSLMEKVRQFGGRNVPDAPFKTQWPELAMKRMLRWAAEHGYDRIAWTPGDVQAERYNLSKQISRIALFDLGGGRSTLRAYDHKNRAVIERDIADPQRELPDLIGKDATEKLLAQEPLRPKLIEKLSATDISIEPGEHGWVISAPDGRRVEIGRGTVENEAAARDYGLRYLNQKAEGINAGRRAAAPGPRELRGLDLKVGGEGMRGFYDKMLPAAMNRYVKKWGARVGTTFLTGPNTDGIANDDSQRGTAIGAKPVHSLDITPAMRASVMQGQPMWRREGSGTSEGEAQPINDTLRARSTPEWTNSAARQKAVRVLLRTLKRKAPQANLVVSENLEGRVDGEPDWFRVTGAYDPVADLVAVALNREATDTAPEFTLDHEILHHLKRSGLVTDAEWSALERAAKDNGWITQDLRDRYPGASESLLTEEAIADAYARWSQDRNPKGLTAAVVRMFRRIQEFFRGLRSDLRGAGITAESVFRAIEGGKIGERKATTASRATAFAKPEQTVLPGAEAISDKELAERRMAERGTQKQKGKVAKDIEDTPLFDTGARKQGSLFERVPPLLPPAEPPSRSPLASAGHRIGQAARALASSVVQDVKMNLAPMAATKSEYAQAAAKDFANWDRLAHAKLNMIFEQWKKRFTPDRLNAMWQALNKASEDSLAGEANPEAALNILNPEERAEVERLTEYGKALWARAEAAGVVQKGAEGIPFYATRIAAKIGLDGKLKLIENTQGIHALDTIGRNLTTKGTDRRIYATADEAERAMKAMFGPDTVLVRNILALPIAFARMERAIAGKNLIQAIKEYGEQSGFDAVNTQGGAEFFTLDHPAFKQYRPRFNREDDGTITAVKDENGDQILDTTSIYVHRDFEGPLRAVLTANKPGAVYNGLMRWKAAATQMIMFSPTIHLAVEFARALPLKPGKMITLRLFRDGYKAKNDEAQMREAILSGLAPIANRGLVADITDTQAEPAISDATGKVISAAKKFSKFWHQTLLWDRIADLQYGIWKTVRDDMMAKGIDRQTASRTAAHLANRYAGALPREAMSGWATKVANVAMFSRSFTLGNLGVFKDMLNGMPEDFRAQIERDAGKLAAVSAQSFARRKAIGAFAIDVALFMAGNALLQMGFSALRGDDWDEIQRGYVRRFHSALRHIGEHPWESLFGLPGSIFHSVNQLLPQGDNEPGKQDRILVGYDSHGRGIYMRSPISKIGEEFLGWMTRAREMALAKESTMLRPIMETLTNDRGFGRQVYNPNDPTLLIIGNVVTNLVRSQLPMSMIEAGRDMLGREGSTRDRTVAALQTFGPFAGLMFSQGHPAGPIGAEIAAQSQEHQAAIRQAMPDINRRLRAAMEPQNEATRTQRLDAAIQEMTALGMSRGQIRRQMQIAGSPDAVVSRSRVVQAYRTANPEQRQRLDLLFGRTAE